MSRLRARCPNCRTLTAVALRAEYECHSCGAQFGAGLVRVPAAYGRGGGPMIAAAALALRYPEVAVVDEDGLSAQNLALAASLADRPLVLGGCCCAHVGAVEGLSARYDRLAVVWFDAHGDLNTPETSPSGNQWGMPFRMLLDGEAVRVEDCALLGSRNLDPPEVEYIRDAGLATDAQALGAVLAGADAVYVAFDVDVLEPGEAGMFMPEPGGMTIEEAAATLREIVAVRRLAGIGFTGLDPSPANATVVETLCGAAGV